MCDEHPNHERPMTTTWCCPPARPSARRLLPVLAALLIPLASAGGQLAELQPGARIRVRAPAVVAGRVEGTVITRTADSVTMTAPGGPTVHVPLAAMTAAEVSRGRSRRDGALKGLAWGTGIGAAMGLISELGGEECPDDRCDDGYSTGEYLAAGVVSGAALGAGIGAIVGAERWERLQLPTRLALSVGRKRATVALALAF